MAATPNTDTATAAPVHIWAVDYGFRTVCAPLDRREGETVHLTQNDDDVTCEVCRRIAFGTEG